LDLFICTVLTSFKIHIFICFFYLTFRRPLRSTLFPYTTLFRSLDDLRARITGQAATAVLAEISPLACDRASLEERIAALVERILARSLLPVINATGVILHTNLGRAPLPESVVEEFRLAATQYSNLEYDLEAGARGKRDVHTAEML